MKAQGGKELERYLAGGRLTPTQAIKAMCFDCMGYYDDGKEDCSIPECPLYPYFPYKKEQSCK